MSKLELIRKSVSLAAIGLMVGGQPVFSAPTDVQVVRGSCGPDSHTAEGPVGTDLASKRSAYHCDLAVIGFMDKVNRHVMVQFTQHDSHHGRIIGYGGVMDASGQTMEVNHLYLEVGHPVEVTDSACKFFFQNRKMNAIVCGAKADEDGERTVAIVSFQALRGQ